MGNPKKSKIGRGLCLSLEGGEGSGKSTQLARLYSWLEQQGLPVLLTRQPGGTRIGEKIRALLLDPSFKELSPRAELLLYEADRAQHVDEVVRPALAAGKIVLSDRFADSSTVYQGICRGLGLTETLRLNAFATDGLQPDLTLLLDLPETTGFKRIERRAQSDRMEQAGPEFHRQVRKGFLTLARKFPRRFKVIDASAEIETVAQEIQAIVKAKLERRGLWKKN